MSKCMLLGAAILLLSSMAVEAVQVNSFTISFNVSLNATTPLSAAALAELQSNFRLLSFPNFPRPQGYDILLQQDAAHKVLSVGLGAAVFTNQATEYFDVVRNTFRATELLPTTSTASLWALVIQKSPLVYAEVAPSPGISGVLTNTPCAPWASGMCTDGTPYQDTTGLFFSIIFNAIVKSANIQATLCVAAGLATREAPMCSQITMITNTPSGGSTIASFRISGTPDVLETYFQIASNAHANHWAFGGRQLVSISMHQPTAAFTTATTVNEISSMAFSVNELSIANSGIGEHTTDDVGCSLQDYWWMVFLIVLFPLGVILLRGIYRQGRLAGVKKAKRSMELEKERQVQLQMMVLNNQHEQAQQQPNTAGAATLPVLTH